MANSFKINSKKILIVEGGDECDIFEHWFKVLKISDVQILGIGGKTQLTENLGLLQKDSDFNNVEYIKIIRDADDNATAAFQSVCSSLRRFNYPTPTVVNTATSNTRRPIVSVFIANNSNGTGSIESYFCKSLSNDKRITCVESYFECVTEKEGTTFVDSKLDIAKLYVYLAGNPDYSRYRLGWTVKKELWDLSKSEFDELRNYISVW